MKLIINLIIISIIFVSCQDSKKNKAIQLLENEEFRSKLTEYINYQEKNKLSKNFDYEILKAINKSDTSIIIELEKELSFYQNQKNHDSTYYWLGIKPQLNQLDTLIKKAFRFHYQRTFDEKLIIITVKSSLQSHWIETIEYKMPCSPFIRPAEYKKECLVVLKKDNHQLTNQKWQRLNELIGQAEYWYLPIDNNKRGLDGSTWSLVGLDRVYNKHHYVFRWSPPMGNDVREICEYLMKISEINIERVY